ncbi:hypothetical protein P261_01265 [Lachnospiraceae bacterium TWA4]|nr:hypothetical protein P261_01265 [Lachnospiraceae bacterium TWA4]
MSVGFIYYLISKNINHNDLDTSKIHTEESLLSGLRKEAKDYYTFALFGVDSRIDKLDSKTRTDSIILLSIHKKSGKVKMLSVYRDTYLNLHDDSYNKINAAYATGGPERAISALNRNFDLAIEDYITVGFAGLADAIDELGGVRIKVEDEEIEYINAYQKTMVKQIGKKYKEVTKSGVQTLNGIQAVSYCRIRYTAGSDYKRTERQRTVLAAMVVKAKKSSPFKLKNAMTAGLRGVQTSLEDTEILKLLPTLVKCKIDDSNGVPFKDYRTTKIVGKKGDCVLPKDLDDNVTLIHEFLYGTTNYRPSVVVQEYSEHIKSLIK